MPDPQSTAPLDSELSELARWLEVPPEPDVTAAVRARLQVPGTTGRQQQRWTWRVAAVLVAVVTLAAAVVAASPRVRAALLDVLRIGAVQLHPGPAPTLSPQSPASQPPWPPPLQAGLESTTLAAARRSATFRVLVPAGTLADPDEVVVERGPHPAYVALRYRPGPGRPPTGPSGMAVQVDEIAGDSSRFFQKYLDGAAARLVDVDGAPGVWVEGPHELWVEDRTGAIRYEPPRLAARTLVWQRDGVTLRLEGDLTLQAALAIATGMQ